MKDSRNAHDSVRPIDEGYIREVGLSLIARALVFLLEPTFSYLLSQERLSLFSGENNYRLPLLSSQGKSLNQVISHLRRKV